MRKIILAIAVFMLVFSANAQIKKSSIFLGGDIGGTVQKTTTNDVTSNKMNVINFSPVFGKAIKENQVFGINAGFNIYETDYPADNGQYKTNGYNAGIFIRRYKNIAKGGFYIFVQGNFGGSYFKQKIERLPSTYIDLDKLKKISVGLSAYPGLSYAVSKKLHLETGFVNLLSLGYFNEKREISDPATTTTYKTNGFSISSSLNNATSYIYLGFRLLLSK